MVFCAFIALWLYASRMAILQVSAQGVKPSFALISTPLAIVSHPCRLLSNHETDCILIGAFLCLLTENNTKGIRDKQAGKLQGSGEGRHAAYPNHLQQFYSQAKEAMVVNANL
jgi:hypothetical protein